MSAITVNTFPSMNAFTSARGWFLAIIVLMHLGLLWALSNGLTIRDIVRLSPPAIVTLLPDETRRPPPAPVIDEPIVNRRLSIPTEQPRARFGEETQNAPVGVVEEPPLPGAGSRTDPEPRTSIVEPSVDPRIGLSEPTYPPPDIRQGNTGTVVLSVEVLPNGRVGAVRIHESSGHPRLDEAALREARRWRLRPGMRDGVPVTMWKQIPITFRLQESVRL